MEISTNKTRTFDSYLENPHQHDLMLANGCMAGVFDNRDNVAQSNKEDIAALDVNGIGIVAHERAINETIFLDNARVGNEPTRLKELNRLRPTFQ